MGRNTSRPPGTKRSRQGSPVDAVTQDHRPLASVPALVALLAIVAFVAVVRLGVAGAPLERDEGEYAYAGQLILQGTPPYEAAYNMKFPGTYYAYSLILAAFGQTPRAIHAGLLVVNAATILLVFLVGRRWLGSWAAVAAAWVFALLSMAPRAVGLAAHATHFVLLPLMAGVWIVTGPTGATRRRALLAGVLVGLAVLMKQHAIVFLPCLVAYVLWRDWRQAGTVVSKLTPAALALVGAAAPFAVLCAVLAAQGVFGAFWFWTIDYARAYVSEVPLSEAPAMFATTWTAITESSLPLWMAGGVGLVVLWVGRWPSDARVVLTGLAVASFAAMCPGFYFREHYFILLLPSVALLTGVAVATVDRWLSRAAPGWIAAGSMLGVVGAVSLVFIAGERTLLVAASPDALSLAVYRTSTFVNARRVAQYVRDHTAPDDRLAVFGSEPEIYFYANRRAATGYIYTYALMEPQPYAAHMQDEMIGQVETAHPKYIVAVLDRTSWLIEPASRRRILEWIPRYLDACYDRVDVAGPPASAETFQVYHWKTDHMCRAGS
jgi:4-amino-4-deoxy-L-arabinose transferase-like glycosyltransferase